MNITDDQARDVVEGRRRMAGFIAGLTPEQRDAALAYDGDDTHPPEEANRRLRINNNLTVRRSSDRIVATVSGPAIATATVGAVNVELSIEEARRMTDALSLLVGTADADDVEVVGCG